MTAGVVLLSAPALAQNDGVAASGVRLRFGISTAGGLLLAAAQEPGGQVAPGEVWDLDVRLGVQFNRIFALYAQPSVAIGMVNGVVCFNMPEAVLVLWAPVLVDFTFADRISVAAGGGLAGVPGAPIGASLNFRVATYPIARRWRNTFIRNGLMIGLETRAYWLTVDRGYEGGLIMLAVGYERF